jgi:hypothetical protein
MAKAVDLLVHRLRTLVNPSRHETDTDGQLLARWLAHRNVHSIVERVFRWLVGAKLG